MSDKDQCRAAFEKWVREIAYGDGGWCKKDDNGTYANEYVDESWTGYRAAWAHLSAELAASREREARLREGFKRAAEALRKLTYVPERDRFRFAGSAYTEAFDALEALSQASTPASEPDVPEVCRSCNGDGYQEYTAGLAIASTCPACNGTGAIATPKEPNR